MYEGDIMKLATNSQLINKSNKTNMAAIQPNDFTHKICWCYIINYLKND